jgi:hypothetical protein
LNSEILVNNSINKNRNKNLLIRNEWTADIEKQKVEIDKNEKKLYEEAKKYKIESSITRITIHFYANK